MLGVQDLLRHRVTAVSRPSPKGHSMMESNDSEPKCVDREASDRSLTERVANDDSLWEALRRDPRA